MGDISDALQAAGLSKNVTASVETAGNYASVVGDVFSAYSTGKSVLQQFGFLAKDLSLQDIRDELTIIENKIDSVLHDLETEILGAARQAIRLATGAKVAEAQTAVQTTATYLQFPNDQEQQMQFGLELHDSVNAIKDLTTTESYWQQVFSPRVFYSDQWSGTLLPSDAPEGGLVFDYRCALPAFLAVIMARIAVGSAADQTFKSTLISDIDSSANKLWTIYVRILTQFIFISPPSLSSYNPPSGTSDWWRTLNYIYGAVERYSGTSIIGGFPWREIPDFMLWDASNPDIVATLPPVLTNPSSPEASRMYDMFAVRYELRTRVLSVALYRKIGLEGLWKTINKLYTMIGEQPAAVPAALRRYTVLSMRDAYSAFPAWLKTVMGGHIGLNQMCGNLGVPRPFSLSRLFS